MIEVRMRTIYAGPTGTCHPGGTIFVDEVEAEDLVNGNYAEYVIEAPKAEEPEDDETEATTESDEEVSDLPEGLIKLSGGYFELPNGEKVRGKAKAIAALGALNATE
jgi:hypothetical protein